MNKAINDLQLHKVVEDYLNGNDFACPLVIFGHPGSGKTEIVRRVAQSVSKTPCCYMDEAGIDKVKELSETLDVNKLFFEISISSTDNAIGIIRRYLHVKMLSPMIIEVSTEHEGECRWIAPMFKGDILWFYYRSTAEDFVRWGRMPNEDGRQRVEEKLLSFLEIYPNMISSYKNREQEIHDEVTATIGSIEDDLKNKKMVEACNKMKDSVKKLLAITLDDDYIKERTHYFVDLLTQYRNTCGMEGDIVATRTVMGFANIPFVNLSDTDK